MKRVNIALIILAALFTASCTDFDNNLTEAEIRYNQNFIDQFGNIDPNQDWNMATLVHANVNLPEIKGDCKLSIMTGEPYKPSTRLLGKTVLHNGCAQLDFDAIKGNNFVYVTIDQGENCFLSKQYKIDNGVLQIGNPITRAAVVPGGFSAECPTILGDRVEGFLPFGKVTSNGKDDWSFVAQACKNTNSCPHYNETIWDTPESFIKHYYEEEPHVGNWAPFNIASTIPNDATELYVQGKQYKLGEVDGTKYVYVPYGGKTYQLPFLNYFSYLSTNTITLQYMENVETAAATPWTRGQGYSLYGPKGFFEEQQYYYGANGKTEDKYNTLYGSTEEEKLATLKTIEDGFVITSKGGPIELPFLYGATQIIDQFGYVLYKEGEDPLSQPHYILMEDGRPDVNIYIGQWYAGENKGSNDMVYGFTGTGMSTWMTGLKAYIDAKDTDVEKCEPGTGIWREPYGKGDPLPLPEHDSYCAIKNCYCTDPEHNGHRPECHYNGGMEYCTCSVKTFNVNGTEGKGIYSSSGEHLPQCSEHYTEFLRNYNQEVYGTKYRLVYFDPISHKSTYNIPAGLKIVFFICPVGTVADLTTRTGYSKNNFHYSDPTLNRRIEHKYGNTESPSYKNGTQTSESGAVKACSWVSGGKTYLGFEDGGNDEDLNDIVFMVDGDFETDRIVTLHEIKWHNNYTGRHMVDDTDLFAIESKPAGASYQQPLTNPKFEGHEFLGWALTPTGTPITGSTDPGFIHGVTPDANVCYFAIWDPMPTPDPIAQSWIFACEDLGGTDDYDFNDVVWKVTKSYEGNNCTGASVSVLAAGGTLPFTFTYDDSQTICTKNNAFMEPSETKEMVNTGNGTSTKTPKSVVLTGIGSDWTVSKNFQKFVVNVEGSGLSQRIQAYQKEETSGSRVPQVIIVPGDWEWPTERTNIKDAYEVFKQWVRDGEAVLWSEWQKHKVSGKTMKLNQ